jgi:uncharacterized membrane protein YdjX (TVP38/TMEM64 family)
LTSRATDPVARSKAGFGLWRILGALLLLAVVGVSLWVGLADTPAVHFLRRLYTDHTFLRRELQAWGVWAPLVFIAMQALQVIIAPIPGELTGFLGGFVFGQWWGLAYSTIGLTLGSLVAFAVGRWLGTTFVQRQVSPAIWARLGFVVEAEGAILCFILYLIPGLPKDLLCYLFGLSPMPFWVFAVASTVGRVPGTWLLSAQGATTAGGQYLHLVLLTALVVAAALPLYVYRHQLVARVSRSRRRGSHIVKG